MTAEEADARFAALVAQHRDGRQRRPAARWPASSARARSSTGVLVAVYVLGALAGLLIHGKPLLVFLIGVPVVLLGRKALRRGADDGGGDQNAA